jgi:hypothetical protein
MYTSKQENAIINFFEANKKLLEVLYNSLIKRGIPTDESGDILAEINDVCRSLFCSVNKCVFLSYENNLNNSNNIWKSAKIYGHFSIILDEMIIESNGINSVKVDKYRDELRFRQCIDGVYKNVKIAEFYELAMKHIVNIQKELDGFIYDFGLPTFDLQSISEFFSAEIFNEQIPKKSSYKKLRDYGITTIVAAAIKKGDYVILGITHSDCRYQVDQKKEIQYSNNGNDDMYYDAGYITSNGEFVTASVAWQIAEEAGLMEESAQSFTRYSEDFYTACKKEFDIPYAKKKIQENLILMIMEKEKKLEEEAKTKKLKRNKNNL